MHQVTLVLGAAERDFNWFAVGHKSSEMWTEASVKYMPLLVLTPETGELTFWSKTYFWAINALKEIHESISGNIKELEACTTSWAEALSNSVDAYHGLKTRIQRQFKPYVDQLSTTREKFKGLREEAKALRDRLFNASGVMESRASTRLGEKVKLLTFVIIFFLPLSFFMSINNTLFSLPALAIIANNIVLATYVIVFNINNIGRGLASGYTFCATNLVAEMKDDNNEEWVDRAHKFNKTQKVNRDELVLLSKWRLVQYALSRPQVAFSVVQRAILSLQQDPAGKRGEEDHPPNRKKENTSADLGPPETPAA
ncbi:uncharacterized protein PAC_10101 [Phialocephala subalpina]|uniref:Uncharacterized protein n=1 Tax=Phialocephala subalpina TaxID=576137 RepID=A0A1L7X5D5_9HELO|nr:uncharacterized protein PAC_10101 [Phialocephala subalpina]